MRTNLSLRMESPAGCNMKNMGAWSVSRASAVGPRRTACRADQYKRSLELLGTSMKPNNSCLAAAAVAALLPFAALPGKALASSHREAPNISRFPTVDSTDFYLFNSYQADRAGYVTLLANYIPLQQP